MLTNETVYEVKALKNLNLITGGKSKLYVAIFQIMIATTGVLIYALNPTSGFLKILGGLVMFGAVVSLCITMFGWQKFCNKQIDKVIQSGKNKFFDGSVTAKYEVTEETEMIDIAVHKDGVQANRLAIPIKNIIKIIATKDYLFLFLSPKQCVIWSKQSMTQGESWEAEFLFKKVLSDRYIEKNVGVEY